jgi:hypothetical protein
MVWVESEERDGFYFWAEFGRYTSRERAEGKADELREYDATFLNTLAFCGLAHFDDDWMLVDLNHVIDDPSRNLMAAVQVTNKLHEPLPPLTVTIERCGHQPVNVQLPDGMIAAAGLRLIAAAIGRYNVATDAKIERDAAEEEEHGTGERLCA